MKLNEIMRDDGQEVKFQGEREGGGECCGEDSGLEKEGVGRAQDGRR